MAQVFVVSGALSYTHSSGTVLGETCVLSSAWAVFCSLPWLGGAPPFSELCLCVCNMVMATRVPKVTVVSHRLGTKCILVPS